MHDVAIGVIGDFCIDAYWDLDTGPPEVSIETGKPTNAVRGQRYSPGGAGNVLDNLAALRVGVLQAFGVIGDDVFGREMMRLFEQRGVDIKGMLVQHHDWDTPVYAKPYRGGDEQQRIDFGRFNTLAGDTETGLLRTINEQVARLDALIINQQLARGICSQGMVRGLLALVARHPEKTIVLDARNRTGEFHGMICKLNASEAARVCGGSAELSNTSIDLLKHHAEMLWQRTKKPIFITRGEHGILVFDGARFHEIGGLKIDGPIDPVGAGDTTVAAIAASLSAGASPEEAAILANLASAVTVQKLRQTGTATAEEIMAMAGR
jgi:rfaE bifunctional protein kinase chain/domain